VISDSPKEECGVLGLYSPAEQAAPLAFFALYALQHRGQEAAGLAVLDEGAIRLHKEKGLVSQVFTEASMRDLTGHLAVGHTRYSTSGSSSLRNAQPFAIETRHGPLALAHNGNLVNAASLRKWILESGAGLSSSSDTEVMVMMLAQAEGDSWEERIRWCMKRWNGAYCITLLTREGVFAARDPWGFRPLHLGQLPSGGWAIASETVALRTVGCEGISEVNAGEIVHLTPHPKRTVGLEPRPQLARCVFEMVYFSRPDSRWDDRSIHQVRQRLGEVLGTEAPCEADVVIPVPDSSTPAAIGYARKTGIPFNDGLIKNRYIGRTFIQPTDSLRRQGVALKFNVLKENVEGKRVVVIDDSIVRGNTSGPLVKLLRAAGAQEVHLRITCPPILHPCYMGVDMGTPEELIANHLSLEGMRARFGADSLQFLSLQGMMRAVGRSEGYCQACFTGHYPLPLTEEQSKTGFEEALA
jgi:amidophosphoribosyltransferase